MPKRQIQNVREYSADGIGWLHIGRNTEKEARFLSDRFSFHAIDLKEILPPLQRPKVVVRDDYIFMILLFPVFNQQSKTIDTVEVDFFIMPDRLVTVCGGQEMPVFEVVFEKLENRPKKSKPLDVAHILHLLLDNLLESIFPMLLHLSQDIDEAQKNLFKSNQQKVILELLRLKINIVTVRKSMQGHKKTIRTLMAAGPSTIPMRRMEEYYDQLVEYTKEIWDTLEVQRDTIYALHDTHESLIKNRTNEVMKTLTVISSVVFPLSLIAGIFSMRVGGFPWQTDPDGFIKVLIILAVTGLGMMGYFKAKRWI